MPTAPPGPCTTPGCPNLRPCPTHQPKAWTPTGNSHPRLRGRAWANARRRIHHRDGPLCATGCGRLGRILDHIDELADWQPGDPDPNRDDNLQLLCQRCHDEKTQQSAAARRSRLIRSATQHSGPSDG